MTEILKRKRVLIIGAGGRVQNNFLPAFKLLSNLYEICGVHSRTTERLLPVARKWDVAAIESLADLDLSRVDLVAISVPTAQNAVVLQALRPHAKHLNILIDTPVAWNRQEMMASRPLLDEFSGVTVAEDYMNFPAFSIVRDATIEGLIGRPRSLSLFNIGYLYHGLALIRSFTGFRPATGVWCKPLGGHGAIVGYEFADGFTATVVGPYRRHQNAGGLLLEGSSGIITEAAIDEYFAAGNKATYVLQAVRRNGELTGYRLFGKDYDVTTELPHLSAMRGMDFPDKSEINLVLGCGLIEVILSVFHDRNMNRNYGHKNAFYDSLASQQAHRGASELDPAGIFAVGGDSKLQWRANADTFLKTSFKNSAMLSDAEKISIKAGDIVEADDKREVGDHTALFGARVRGRTLPGESWFLFRPAWQRFGA